MKKIILLIFIISLISCATSINVTDVYSKETEADPGYGYLFGKLAINSNNGNFALEFLNLDNPLDGNIIISFIKYKDNINSAGLTVVPVLPGKYALKNVLYLIGRNKLYSQKEITIQDVTHEFTVEPGKCYYIGHWFAAFTETSSDGGQSVLWELDSITDQSGQAFKELPEQYPLFAGMELISFFPDKEK